jgi:hypothetical protein
MRFSEFWQNERLFIKRGWKDFRHADRASVVWTAVLSVLSGMYLFMSGRLQQPEKVWESVTIPFIVLGSGLLVRFLWFCFLAPNRMYRELKKDFDHQKKELEDNRRPITDMEGWEVLEYMVENSGLTEKREVEDQLREWATANKLFVEGKPLSDDDYIVVPDHYFKVGFTFNLVPKKAALRERFGCFGNELSGGSICHVNNPKWVTYVDVRFRRKQIESLSKSLRADN